MKRTTLESLSDGECIFSNGTDVLVAGKYLRLFRADGTFVTKFAPIRRPRRVAMLPGRTALVEGAADKAYHYLSLEEGRILWTCPQKGHSPMDGPHRFALSPDGSSAYVLHHPQFETLEAEQIRPLEQTCKKIRTNFTLRSTEDIFCDGEGTLCALQSHIVQKCDHLGIPLEPGYWQHGILALPFDGREPYWKRQWQTDAYKCARICDGRYILYEDFSILDLNTGEWSRLLSQEACESLPNRGFIWNFDPQRCLLTVRYIGARLHVVIDCKSRQVTAKYIPEESRFGFPGCLVGEEFWMGSPQGVLRLPYPYFQEGDFRENHNFLF